MHGVPPPTVPNPGRQSATVMDHMWHNLNNISCGQVEALAIVTFTQPQGGVGIALLCISRQLLQVHHLHSVYCSLPSAN